MQGFEQALMHTLGPKSQTQEPDPRTGPRNRTQEPNRIYRVYRGEAIFVQILEHGPVHRSLQDERAQGPDFHAPRSEYKGGF